jgi:hypothetical protein
VCHEEKDHYWKHVGRIEGRPDYRAYFWISREFYMDDFDVMHDLEPEEYPRPIPMEDDDPGWEPAHWETVMAFVKCGDCGKDVVQFPHKAKQCWNCRAPVVVA